MVNSPFYSIMIDSLGYYHESALKRSKASYAVWIRMFVIVIASSRLNTCLEIALFFDSSFLG